MFGANDNEPVESLEAMAQWHLGDYAYVPYVGKGPRLGPDSKWKRFTDGKTFS